MHVPAGECGDCHEDQLAAWRASRHRSAWTNDLFQAGFLAEPRMFCVRCHAPLEIQQAEIRSNLPVYRALGAGHRGPAPPMQPEPTAEEGVSCVVCHMRGGRIQGPRAVDELQSDSPHPVDAVPGMQSSDFCRSCHEFPIPSWVDGRLYLSDAPMQSTWSEWAAWAADQPAPAATCQTCHMPDGKHHFDGAHDRERLARSIRVEAGPGALRLTLVDVGHALPSGDLFRRLTLDIESADGWTTLWEGGRRFAVDHDAAGRPVKHQTADTRLWPGQPQRIPLPASAAGRRWRLVWHDGSPADEARGLLDLAGITPVLHEGRVPASLGGG